MQTPLSGVTVATCRQKRRDAGSLFLTSGSVVYRYSIFCTQLDTTTILRNQTTSREALEILDVLYSFGKTPHVCKIQREDTSRTPCRITRTMFFLGRET